MREYKAGELHSGKGGKVVKSRRQAVAIALSEAGKAKKK
jgi:ribosomal protein L21E